MQILSVRQAESGGGGVEGGREPSDHFGARAVMRSHRTRCPIIGCESRTIHAAILGPEPERV